MLVTPPICPLQSYIEYCYLHKFNKTQKQFFQVSFTERIRKVLCNTQLTSYVLDSKNKPDQVKVVNILRNTIIQMGNFIGYSKMDDCLS